MAEFVLPEVMVQAAVGCWLVRAATSVEASPEEHVRAILTAALAECEVREEWGVRSTWPNGDVADYVRGPRSMAEASAKAQERAGFHVKPTLIRQLIITTSAEEVPS